VVFLRAGRLTLRAGEATTGFATSWSNMLFSRLARTTPTHFALNRAIERALRNASSGETGHDYSLYQVTLHPRDLGGALDILGDLFSCAGLVSDLDLERGHRARGDLDDFDERGRRINIRTIWRARLSWSGHPLGFPLPGPNATSGASRAPMWSGISGACYGAAQTWSLCVARSGSAGGRAGAGQAGLWPSALGATAAALAASPRG